ncbi:50S ribosomal protein L29 [Spiroplasma tabanidicola]|uniref:Large ribosomal subunit protein uL29 n=1 Tax=Spiroplasma tabanidicola TaxID=324079 RepID=A0A6I6CBM1_9MOLU|nr:50S ribosomal protein L29 [Spiroplasma tabanidicola]QGS52365.1 50S ribosomal protein L29 [Spiroplasma tabanidicola]
MSKVADLVLELRAKSVADLIKQSEDHKAELFALRFQAAVGSLEQTHKINALRKNIARIETLLAERKRAGEVTKNIVVKPDYAKAVDNAEQAGKAVRAKQREMLEKMQQEQYGQGSVSDNAIEAAMAAAVEGNTEASSDNNVEAKSSAKPAAKKAGASKPEAPVEVVAEAKAVVKEVKAKAKEVKAENNLEKAEEKVSKAKAEAKPVAEAKAKVAKAKVAEAKAEVEEAQVEVKVAKAKVASKKSSSTSVEEPKPVGIGKPAVATKKAKVAEAKTIEVEVGEAKATGKGKAALGEVKTKKIKVEAAKGEDIEAIDLKLSKKPKDIKTYTYGSNADEAKKQIDEANKKLAAKKDTKTKGAK